MKRDNIRLQVELRDPPDIKRLVRVAIQLANELPTAERKRYEAKDRRRPSTKKTT